MNRAREHAPRCVCTRQSLVVLVVASMACARAPSSTRSTELASSDASVTTVRSDAPPKVSALTPSAARACLALPVDLKPRTTDGGWEKIQGWTAPEARVGLESVSKTGNPSWPSSPELIEIFVYRGAEAFSSLWPDKVQPFPAVAVGSRASNLSGVGAGMSGSLVWTDLPSPHATYTTVVVWGHGPHDGIRTGDTDTEAAYQRLGAVLDDRAATGHVMACLDALLWP